MMIAGLPCIWGPEKHHCATYLLSFLSGADNPGSRYPCLSHNTPRSNFIEERQAMRYISRLIRS